VALWIGFGIFLAAAIYFLFQFVTFHYFDEIEVETKLVDDALSEAGGRKFLAAPVLHAGLVCLIASLAYLTMAAKMGFYARCFDGREFYYVRYIDWVLTTPMMLHALCHFGNARGDLTFYLLQTDVLMILAGLIGGTVDGGYKWGFFTFATLCFLPILYYLIVLRSQVLDNRIYNSAGSLLLTDGTLPTGPAAADAQLLPYLFFFPNYANLAALTILAWTCYPIIWILAEGTGVLSSTGEAIAYTVLDLISKAVFGAFVVTSHRYKLSEITDVEFELVGGKPSKGVVKEVAGVLVEAGGSFL
jgi:bacteriorhodopsin